MRTETFLPFRLSVMTEELQQNKFKQYIIPHYIGGKYQYTTVNIRIKVVLVKNVINFTWSLFYLQDSKTVPWLSHSYRL